MIPADAMLAFNVALEWVAGVLGLTAAICFVLALVCGLAAFLGYGPHARKVTR